MSDFKIFNFYGYWADEESCRIEPQPQVAVNPNDGQVYLVVAEGSTSTMEYEGETWTHDVEAGCFRLDEATQHGNPDMPPTWHCYRAELPTALLPVVTRLKPPQKHRQVTDDFTPAW